jgi:hypothetical protein
LLWFLYGLYSSGLKQGVQLEQSKQNLLTIHFQNDIIQTQKFKQELSSKVVKTKVKQRSKNNNDNTIDNDNYRHEWLRLIYSYQANNQ